MINTNNSSPPLHCSKKFQKIKILKFYNQVMINLCFQYIAIYW